jgi:hypothetical protein
LFAHLFRIAAAVFIVAATVGAHRQIPTTTRVQRGESFVPKPEFAKATSLGFDALLADFYWLWAVQVVGGTDVGPSQHATQLGRLIDLVTTLDPWVDHPYRFAAVWMIDSEENVRQANRLLERGIEHHPDDWRNYFYLGFNHFFYLQENGLAADWLEEAIERPGAPRYLPRLVAKLRSESADIYAAAVFLEQLVREAPDEETRAWYQGALDEIEVEHQARQLEQARANYEKLVGRELTSVEDLARGPHAVLERLPSAEPSSLPLPLRRGSTWQIDPESDRIVSSYYGRRYELSVHALDARRMQEWKELREAKQREPAQEERK